MSELGEMLRNAMRRWTTGVTVVTTSDGATRHGMTVNSFTSVSLDPPCVSVTMDNRTRTHQLVLKSGHFGVTILSSEQKELADLFAGKLSESSRRFAGLATFQLVSGAPFIEGGLAFIDCKIIHTFSLPRSTLFVGSVLTARVEDKVTPLIYLNRSFHQSLP